jgi:hypothetical protein
VLFVARLDLVPVLVPPRGVLQLLAVHWQRGDVRDVLRHSYVHILRNVPSLVVSSVAAVGAVVVRTQTHRSGLSYLRLGAAVRRVSERSIAATCGRGASSSLSHLNWVFHYENVIYNRSINNYLLN